MISVIILTKNESADIGACLEHLSWCDDVSILDSGSIDNTVEIGKQFACRIYTNPFESFGKQRNFALDHIETKYNWILFLDADEHVDDDFLQAMRTSVSNAKDSIAGFYCCWKMILDDVWLKRCDNFPKWQFRLMRKGRARFKDFGHGQKEDQVQGEIAYIKVPYLHYGFSKGWSAWIERHNRYSSQEAKARLEQKPPFSDIFSKHGSSRNPALKSWLSALPGWPLLRFIQAYVFNLGFLEGKPGFIYCTNMAYYEFLIKIKMRELRFTRKKQGNQ